jgi:hypothetical protein
MQEKVNIRHPSGDVQELCPRPGISFAKNVNYLFLGFVCLPTTQRHHVLEDWNVNEEGTLTF